jgi:hypothetical protein
MSERSSWTGSAADLLRGSLEDTGEIPMTSIGWPKNPRALAGRLRRAQTFLRALGIDIAFSREGRAGSRVIRMRTSLESTVSTVSSVTNSGRLRTTVQGHGKSRFTTKTIDWARVQSCR